MDLYIYFSLRPVPRRYLLFVASRMALGYTRPAGRVSHFCCQLMPGSPQSVCDCRLLLLSVIISAQNKNGVPFYDTPHYCDY